MAFRPTLVALEEVGSSYPYLGLPFTEIALSEPGGADASNPHKGGIGIEIRDKITEGVTGADSVVPRRKLTVIELPEVDYVTPDTKAQIERLIHDGRPLYFCPNVGPDTRWSFPLQRSLADFMGRKTVANTRTGALYCWDAADQVMRSWDTDEAAFAFGGAWSRFLRTQSAMVNAASKPHPDSVSTGWSTAVGSPSIAYSESVLTPVLARRGVTNGKGVTAIYCPVGGTAAETIHIATGAISGASPMCCSFLMKHQGSITARLTNSVGAVLGSKTVQGNGQWHLIQVYYANGTAETTAAIRLVFNETTAKKQAALVGPVFIGNCNSYSMVDWHSGTADDDLPQATDTVKHLVTDMTVTWFAKRPPIEITGNGYFVIGASSGNWINVGFASGATMSVFNSGPVSPVSFTNIWTLGGVGYGEWAHFALTFSDDLGIALYVNGVPHAANGTYAWDPIDFLDDLVVGRQTGTVRCLDGAGMSHLRMDARAWSAQEVIDHYDTYFKHFGRGIVEPAFGKVFRIDSVDWSPRFGSGDVQWLASMTLIEVSADENFAGMIRQEGDI